MYTFLLKRFGTIGAAIIVAFIIGIFSFLSTALVDILFHLDLNTAGLIISFVLPIIIAPPAIYLEMNAVQRLNEAHEKLNILATTDVLTGIPNRRHFIQLAEEALSAIPATQYFSLAVIDIDRFKLINDQYGHLIGDEALIAIAHAIRDHLPEEAIYGRFGGDEFIAICRKNAPNDFNEISLHILDHIHTLYVGNDETQTRLSATIGITSMMPENHTLRDYIAQADSALLKAKRMGGGQVHLFHSSSS